MRRSTSNKIAFACIRYEVAGVFPFEIRSEVPPRELAIAGFRLCVLREDGSVACGDGATSASAAKLLTHMRIELSTQVDGVPE